MGSATLRIALPVRLVLLSALFFAGACFAREGAPLRIITPVGPGGASDVIARIVGERLAVALGRPVVVDNRPGATGKIAMDALKQAPAADTLIVAPIAVAVVAPLALRDPGYDPARDLTPVSQLATFDYALAVPVQSSARTVAQFVEWARQNPGEANYGATGAGSVPHLLGTHLSHVAHVPLTFISYRSFALLETDLVGGHIASALTPTPDLAGLHKSGKVRILATSGATRSSLLPDVPTFREIGLAAFETIGWTAVFASPRAPRHMVDAWSAAIAQALADPATVAQLRAAGALPTGTTPVELADIIARDRTRWQAIVRASGYKRDASD